MRVNSCTHTHTHTQIHTADPRSTCHNSSSSVTHLLVKSKGSLICPASSNVAYGIAATANHKERLAKALHELNAFAVAFDREIEGAEPVANKRENYISTNGKSPCRKMTQHTTHKIFICRDLPIANKRVCTALEEDSARLVLFHDSSHHLQTTRVGREGDSH